jgi:hypothetical protein
MSLISYLTAIALIAVAATAVAWFLRYKARASDRRLVSMLKHAGVNPAITESNDAAAIIREIAGDAAAASPRTCQRWLAGGRVGSNDFCPNAQALEPLAAATRPAERLRVIVYSVSVVRPRCGRGIGLNKPQPPSLRIAH